MVDAYCPADLEESFFVGDAAGRDGDINHGSASDKYGNEESINTSIHHSFSTWH